MDKIVYTIFGLSFIGTIVSVVWCKKRLRSGSAVMWPFAFVVGNVVILLGTSFLVVYSLWLS